MSEQIIKNGKVVFFNYTLTNDEGEVLDSSEGQDPLAYLHGAENIVPGLERQLEGKTVGDKLVADVEPEDGYGERIKDALRMAPRNVFPDGAVLLPGMQIFLEDEEGEHFPAWIQQVTDEMVILDSNHPLAGVTLHFDVEIVEIRDADANEIAHGHPHLPGMHAHH